MFLFLQIYDSVGKRFVRAYIDAVKAIDAPGNINLVLQEIDTGRFASDGTSATPGTFSFIKFYSENGYFGKKSQQRANRTDHIAVKPAFCKGLSTDKYKKQGRDCICQQLVTFHSNMIESIKVEFMKYTGYKIIYNNNPGFAKIGHKPAEDTVRIQQDEQVYSPYNCNNESCSKK